MLLIADSFRKLSFRKLMEVYIEGNQENGAAIAPEESPERQAELAEQIFYDYLRNDFFTRKGAFYAVWEEGGSYVCALRLEPYRDGFLLEALETKPEQRRKGCATQLMSAVLPILRQQGIGCVYSHVSKTNIASLRTHASTGFQIISDSAAYVDGSVNHRAYTFWLDLKG